MGFTEHKIGAFTHKISDLPDQPQLTPQELKARFDSAPEELRQALGAVCDEGEALTKRIDAYRAQTFEGEVTRDMLAEPVREELAGKAEQNELAAVQTALAQKCEIYIGSYIGDGQAERLIDLGFKPKAVFSLHDGYQMDYNSNYCYGGLAVEGHPVMFRSKVVLELAENGFTVYKVVLGSSAGLNTNTANAVYHFIAIR